MKSLLKRTAFIWLDYQVLPTFTSPHFSPYFTVVSHGDSGELLYLRNRANARRKTVPSLVSSTLPRRERKMRKHSRFSSVETISRNSLAESFSFLAARE